MAPKVVVRPPEPDHREPDRWECECGEEVLGLDLPNGVRVVVDVQEVTPPGRCPLCAAVETRGQDRGPWCWRCGGTAVVGEPLPQPAIALDPYGRARVFKGRRRKGEAIHRLHPCALKKCA